MPEYMFSDRLDGETHAIVCNATTHTHDTVPLRSMTVKWNEDLRSWHGTWVQPLPPEPVETHKTRTFHEMRAGRERAIVLAAVQAGGPDTLPLRWATEEQWGMLLGLCVGGYAKHIILFPKPPEPKINQWTP